MHEKQTATGGQPVASHRNGYQTNVLSSIPQDVSRANPSDSAAINTESSTQAKGRAPAFILRTADAMPQLPKAAQLDPSLADGVSPWLDEYVKHSSRWSPKAYVNFHEATGLWLLSTVAARRVGYQLNDVGHTGLYVALLGRTSVYRKTTTAKVGYKVLGAAGLKHLLCPDEMTPQAFVQYLAKDNIPGHYSKMTEEEQEQAKEGLALAGQKGWYYDEFGMKVAGLMRSDGHMSEYRGILRVMDDGREEYSYSTIARGEATIKNPYLALLCNMTPADLQKFAGKGAPLWRDGFWARFAFVSPPQDGSGRGKGRWPNELQIPPISLLMPLREWHKRLGVPHVAVEEDEESKRLIARISKTEPIALSLAKDVYEAFNNYSEGLAELVVASDNTDLDGNYTRFPEKALRIATLLASFQGEREITLSYWAKGQQIAERWRADLHNLYDELASEVEQSEERTVEEAMLTQLEKRGQMTARELRNYIKKSTDEIGAALHSLTESGQIVRIDAGRTTRYARAD